LIAFYDRGLPYGNTFNIKSYLAYAERPEGSPRSGLKDYPTFGTVFYKTRSRRLEQWEDI